MTARSFRMFVDGAWCDAASGATYDLPNPATEQTVATVPDAGPEDVERAIAAARRAFDEGPWPATSVADRASVLTRIGEKIQDRKQDFRELLVAAHGATRSTHIVQLETPIYLLYNYAELTSRYPFVEAMPDLPVPTRTGLLTTRSEVVRQPAGVCGLIPTWNFPLFVTINKIAPALATGCTMVVKPSPWGPAIDLLLAEVLAECDLPPGVVNVVTGQSPALGEALTTSPAVDRISFTGSVPTGKAIMRASADTLKRLHLELGGKSALIVLDDADLEAAASACAMPATFHAGQGCAMTTRVLVPRARHDELVEAMVAHLAGSVRIGDPADREVTLGPVIRPERLAAIEAMVAGGLEQGARLATGGQRPAGRERGWFFEPTIFADVSNDLAVAREEIFGPVVCVIPYEGDDEAVRIANDSSMGLFGGILSPDLGRARGLARRLRTGGVAINQGVNLLHNPFGGFKESGIGREGGVHGLDEMTELQTIAWNE